MTAPKASYKRGVPEQPHLQVAFGSSLRVRLISGAEDTVVSGPYDVVAQHAVRAVKMLDSLTLSMPYLQLHGNNGMLNHSMRPDQLQWFEAWSRHRRWGEAVKSAQGSYGTLMITAVTDLNRNVRLLLGTPLGQRQTVTVAPDVTLAALLEELKPMFANPTAPYDESSAPQASQTDTSAGGQKKRAIRRRAP